MSTNPDGQKAYVTGKNEDDVLRAVYGDQDGTQMRGGAGNDTLKGGNYDDILVGGKGNDQLWGGLGADQFRFFGDEIDGPSDRDRIMDLKFEEGDMLVFGKFGSGTFADMEGSNAYNGGANVQISSWEGLVNAAAFSDLVTVTRASPYNNNLLLSITNAATGQVQEVLISHGWQQYVDAGGTHGL